MTTATAFKPTSELALTIAQRVEGRGTGIKSLADKKSDIYRLNPYLIHVEGGFNVRDFENPEVSNHIDLLAQSIAEVGVKSPLTAVSKTIDGETVFVLRDGECRLRATIRAIEVYGAEILNVPVVLTERHESKIDAAARLVTQNSGLRLDMNGLAKVATRLIDYGCSREETAKKMMLSTSYIGNLLRYASLDRPIHDMVSSGTISGSTALLVARQNNFDSDATLSILKEAAANIEEGQTKVKPRNVTARPKADRKAPVKEEIARLISLANFVENEDSKTVTLSMSMDEWNELKTLAGLAS